MTLKQFRDILLTVSDDVYHLESHKESEYIIWHEVGGFKLSGDNSSAETARMIAVDFFTREEYSDIPDKLTAALENCDEIAVDTPEVIYDEDSHLIHYAWTAEVI